MFQKFAFLTALLTALIFSHTGIALADETDETAPPKERTQLLGDWGGIRSALAAHGVIVDIDAIQYYQGVVDGSSGSDDGQYGAKFRYNVTLLGEKLGLWKGLAASILIHTRLGDDVNALSGLSPANTDLLIALPGEDRTDITQFFVTQKVAPELLLAAGKFDAINFFETGFHSGNGVDKFMNSSLVFPFPLAVRTVPTSIMGAGALKLKGPEIQGALLAYDPNNSSDRSGFDPLFDDAAVVGMWKFFHDSRGGGRPGYIAFGGTYSDKQYKVIDPSSLAIIPGQGLAVTGTDESWSVFSVIHHQLWADSSNPSRDLRFTGQFAYTDGEANPVEWGASAALELNGPIPRRPKDIFGVGYFRNEYSDGFKNTVGPLLSVAATIANMTPTRINVEDTEGVEVYYKAQVTPWFALTGDVQVITESLSNEDTKVVVGARGKVTF